jgi:predicted Zn finger-like uncharacterized protein
MIIDCINCNKKFNVDSKLIPSNGRQIQCGSCSYTWHYKILETPANPLILDETDLPILSNVDNDLKIADNENIGKDKLPTTPRQETNVKKKAISKFFSYLLVCIISFIALLILIDTLKTPLINIFPQLEVILFNFFETLKDVKLFIIDLT